jgi:putative phosphoesterase
MAKVVGIISDTHGLMRQPALDALAGVELILHAGDVGTPEVLTALAAIAPVVAVRGNVDTGTWAATLPETAEVTVEQSRFYMLHNIADLAINPASEGYRAVIFGHSHKALEEVRNGVLCLNPGSAGPRRFRLPVTLMKVVVDGKKLIPQLVTIEV